ncbi:(2Fe-2S)-binding protein [Salinibacter sp. 10B]|uniref:molybdopterin-dependent oxidoreductase n=1 Tax=Salinibacter sp. 10B TaxID=1923971 RepID=UPI000CF3A8F9|nr:molybdopterin-dependent oxidoreductase [Salinibacter sp. 10B]PQJ35603.1 (2Fe-2S)-binding protein [Salinibacter sp. 10B]
MPIVTIDGTTYEYEGEQKLLQFCLNQGIELPHFCYHPAMSIPANCRQCLVKVGMPKKDRETGEVELNEDGEPEIQYMPGLQASCTIDLADGMVVQTHRSSEEVRDAQTDNLEFLLANHPLDCPICDQAGHCPLQIQAYKYGPEGSRFEFRKVHKPKRVKLGPRVTLDAERCINCTRCTRFTDEVSESGQLTITNRGVKNYPMTAPGETFDDPYSMNTIDICPVGALTATDFRFKARIWEMSSTPSITTTNATGANCHYWVRDNQVLRITPRQNMAVNEHWLPDEDRLVYNKFNDNRPDGPHIRTSDTLKGAQWDQAFAKVASLLGSADPERTLFLGSAHATVEDNYLLKQLAEAVGAEPPRYIPHLEPGAGDDWLITDDKTPNAQGCERLGIQPIDEELVGSRIEKGKYDLVYVLEDDPVGSGLCTAEALKTQDVDVVLHYYNTTNETLPHATAALPAAMVVETVGTYVNQDGRAQRVRPAKEIQGVNRTLMMEMGTNREDEHGTPFDRWHNDENKINCKPSWELLPEIAQKLGVEMNYTKGPKEIMDEVQSEIDAFEGATYDAMGLKGVQLEEVETGEAV